MPTLAAKTHYMAKAMLQHILDSNTLYVALYNVDPEKTGIAGVEVTGGGYARQVVTFGELSDEGSVSNSTPIIFPDVLSPWGSVGGFALMDAQDGGNMLYRGALERPDPDNIGSYIPQATTPAVGDVFIIKANQLALTEK